MHLHSEMRKNCATATSAAQVLRALHALANPDKAKFSARFFKTGRGEYAQGDQFLGITVPLIRQCAKRYATLSLEQVGALLASHYNEARLLGLLILVRQYAVAETDAQAAIYRFYCAQRHRVNNWNLVDSSAPYIVGAHLLHRQRDVLYAWAQSPSVWERRIAVLASFAFIRANDCTDTLRLVQQLLSDPHDLMHKACGWMLREVGKRDAALLHAFLAQHGTRMPRTMLRYAIERFPPEQRLAYLRAR